MVGFNLNGIFHVLRLKSILTPRAKHLAGVPPSSRGNGSKKSSLLGGRHEFSKGFWTTLKRLAIEVSGSDWLYRRIPPIELMVPQHEVLGQRWPSSATLQPSSNEDDVSVYAGSMLEARGLTPGDVLEKHDGFGLFRFRAIAAVRGGLTLVLDPLENQQRPLRVDPAHALLTGTPKSKKASRKPARAILSDPDTELLFLPFIQERPGAQRFSPSR